MFGRRRAARARAGPEDLQREAIIEAAAKKIQKAFRSYNAYLHGELEEIVRA